MKKPRIVILMHYLELGGAEMALIGLLHALDPKRVDVDLFVYSHRGPLMRYIPKWVNLLPEVGAYSVIEEPMAVALRKAQVMVGMARILTKLQQKYGGKPKNSHNDISIYSHLGYYLNKVLPKINPMVEYDLCISFLIPHNFALDKVRAKKRLAWIHTDYSTVDIDAERELPVWGAYDKIVSISDEVTKGFLRRFPSLQPKIIRVENMLPSEYVRSRAVEYDARPELKGEVNLLSVGRFCTAKNYDNVPDIAHRVQAHGISDLKWYIIGFGGDEALIRQRIKEAGMEEHVILLGKKDNPYPYIKACDIYVQPSRYEGKSVTVREAQILCKPVAVTAYPTAASQIQDGVDGVIVPLDNEGCARGLADFIKNEPLRHRMVSNLRSLDFGNESEVNKIYSLLSSV